MKTPQTAAINHKHHPAVGGVGDLMTRNRKIPFLLAGASLIGFILSAGAMARRLGDFNEHFDRDVFRFEFIETREFTFADRKVSLLDEARTGTDTYLRVTYGQESIRLRVTIPGDSRLPDLVPHERWLRVLWFIPIHDPHADEKVSERMVIVTLTPPPGTDPDAYGRAWRKEWDFDFYELLADGQIQHQRLGFPTTKRHEASRKDELIEGTWQWYAALALIPPGQAPKYKFINTGMDAAGVTLPLAAVFLLASVGFLAAAVAPRRITDASA